VLSVDIRKLPSSTQTKRQRGSARSSIINIPETIIVSGSSPSLRSGGEESSGATTVVGSVVEFQPQIPPSRSNSAIVAKKRKSNLGGKTTQIGETRYYSEYDHPEDNEDDENGYYIYVDPDAPEESWVPFKDTFSNLFGGVKNILTRKTKPRVSEAWDEQFGQRPSVSEDTPLLWPSGISILPKAPFSEEETGASSSESEDDDHAAMVNRYGTFLRQEFNPAADSEHTHDVITLTLFASISLFFSATISIVLLVLSAVGKHKAQEEVDIVVSLGVFISLAFAMAGFWGLVVKQAGAARKPTWGRWILAGTVFGGVLLIDGLLMGKLVGELRSGGSTP
jgi:uncharacterized membrane protein